MEKEHKSFCVFEKDPEKAIDMAVYGNFTSRNLTPNNFSVINGPEDDYAIVNTQMLSTLDNPIIHKLHKDYSEMEFKHIEAIFTDTDPLPHWESIKGIFATQNGEILRFLLAMNIPIEKFIRYELASRGHDKDHKWCGFEQARKVWLEEK
ncbi:MAG: hypothetical protein HKN39_02285 [Flavobacteriales bacterium]|nr:hypothetical protein [Flavobacteriales bacterium]